MSVPPILMGVVFLFWGWQVGNPWFGIPCALVFGGSGLIRQRWNFTQTDLDQIWNFCVMLFLGLVIFGLVSSGAAASLGELARDNNPGSRLAAFQQGARSMVRVLAWLPLAMLPILGAQVFGTRNSMEWSTFSWWLRARRKKAGEAPRNDIGDGRLDGGGLPGLNVTWPMFALCLLSASAGNDRGFGFPVGLGILVLAALWINRSRGYSNLAMAASLAGVLLVGATVFACLKGVQMLDQKIQAALGARWGGNKGFDPKQSRTALGAIGELKLSGSILMRVSSEGPPPELLREASYRFFRSPQWSAPRQTFASVTPEPDLTSWKLSQKLLPKRTVLISRKGSSGAQLLAVPMGAALVEELPAGQLEINPTAAIQISEVPGLLQYRVGYDPVGSLDSEPDALDLEMPELEKPAVEETGVLLGLGSAGSEKQKMDRIASFFQKNFKYSTWLGISKGGSTNGTPLSRFLLRERRGHCEYFATATVLLLRQAGIPARYASGYAVQEKRGKTWVIRGRHAHAWALAWMNGRWVDVDNTPGSWVEADAGGASMFQRVSDWFSDVSLAIARVRWGKGEWKEHVPWAILLMVVYASWRLMSRKQWKRADAANLSGEAEGGAIPGRDSEFYVIERELVERGLSRLAHETPRAWSLRILKESPSLQTGLDQLLDLHYRLRFDPEGLNEVDRRKLAQQVEAWLASFRRNQGVDSGQE